MSSQTTDYLSAIKGLDEDFQSYALIAFTFIILIIFIGYMIYLTKLERSECSYMNNLYSSNMVQILAQLNDNKIYVKEYNSNPDIKHKIYRYIFFSNNISQKKKIYTNLFYMF